MRVNPPPFSHVAQVSNLLFRRFPIGRACKLPRTSGVQAICRLETCETVPMHREKSALHAREVSILLLLSLLTACRTIPELPSANLSDPGWTVQQGQAVWKPNKNSAEIAGELVAATRPDGQTLLQFIKTPFPIVIAQTTSNLWRMEIPAEDRVVQGRGAPPSRAGWLQLARALAGQTVARSWQFRRDGPDWLLENPSHGEVLSGYFSP